MHINWGSAMTRHSAGHGAWEVNKALIPGSCSPGKHRETQWQCCVINSKGKDLPKGKRGPIRASVQPGGWNRWMGGGLRSQACL